ncbi:MAG: phosphatidate cytidylyltransferase [Pseudomonadales bacterium]|nr:phosphatidate cytidylyltransferase [Pseudomonadales bacterium]
MIEGLKLRIITAVILLLALIVATTLLSPYYFAFLMAVVVLIASWEWAGLIGLDTRRARISYQTTIALMLMGAFFLIEVRPGATTIDAMRSSMVLLLGLIWWIVAFFMLQGYPQNTEQWNDKSRIGLMGVLTLVPTWVGVVMLKYLAPQGYLVIGLVIMVAAVDVGAYFAGNFFGKRKLAPQLSPNKSWEGVWGGVGTCIAVGLLFIWALHNYVTALNAWQVATLLGLCLVIACFAVVGDLMESMLKRNSRVKDSGQLLPGHGGVLDRVDGLVAVTPAYVLTLLLTLFELE